MWCANAQRCPHLPKISLYKMAIFGGRMGVRVIFPRARGQIYTHKAVGKV